MPHHPTVLRVLLASASPRRADLLRAAGVDVVVRPVDCDETAQRGETAVALAQRLAREKLEAALARLDDDDACTGLDAVAADTVVWLGEDEETSAPLGKPSDRSHARTLLAALGTGVPHCVTTGWAIARRGEPVQAQATTTRVVMRSLRDAEIDAYLSTDEWTDKAGGYGIQGAAAGWIERIEGSYTNVVGLPLSEVLGSLWTRWESRR